MKVGVLGSGVVGQVLASGFLKHGHQVALGTGSPAKLGSWAKQNPTGAVGSFDLAAAFGEVIMLAVKGDAAAEVLRQAGAVNLAEKPILDATNPIADAPPVDGVLPFFTTHSQSLMERLQAEFPAARFVKCFNSVGAASMVNPHFAGGKPSMFICGNNGTAKKTAAAILDQFGWESEDMGSAVAARAIEPLCMLWCIPGFQRNDWAHAFKVLR